jgi:Protein of unknown function (DUF3373)
MKRFTRKAVAATLLLGLIVPLSALAADQDVQQKIDALTQEVEALKHDVSQTKQKSLGQWLSIGGDYRVRFDSLRGATAAYVDVNKTFAFAQEQMNLGFASNPVAFGPAVANFLTFQKNMKSATTFNAARTFLAANGAPGGLLDPTNPGGLFAFAQQVPAQTVANDAMYTNRFGLNLHAKATEDVTVNARLLMYKVTGAQDESAITGSGVGPFFADRVGVFDGAIGHVPSDNKLLVDQVYATWKNIAGQPLWFSVGRRPSTGGIPSQLKQNNERPGNAGTPASVIDFAFDGGTIGVAPDIDILPGAYAKVCFGRGFDSGIVSDSAPHLHDTDFLGVAIIPYDTDPLRIDFQWARGFNLFDFPVMNNTAFGNTAPSVELGNVDWYELGALSTLKNVGPGTLNLFGTVAMNVTHPNNSVSANAGFEGLLTGQFFQPEAPTDKTGWVAWVGGRYDVTASGTKIGAEYNHGSKNWFGMLPASDDLWTSKVGTRGNVYEGYIIQELPLKPISSYVSKAFFRAGYQYYDFEYTGSNNWVGAPMKISDITPGTMLLTTPLKKAQDIYVTFEVHF